MNGGGRGENDVIGGKEGANGGLSLLIAPTTDAGSVSSGMSTTASAHGGGSLVPRTPSRSAAAGRNSAEASARATALPPPNASLPLAYPRRLQPRAVDYEKKRLYDA
jgi:hypothetical protein